MFYERKPSSKLFPIVLFLDEKMKCVGLFISAILGLVPWASCACYKPDGTAADSEYVPCQSSGVSMCCALDRSNPSGGLLSNGYTVDICLENGLCRNNFETTNSNGQLTRGTTFWRESCSSSNWSECLNLCANEEVRRLMIPSVCWTTWLINCRIPTRTLR
jgi:hypothetical protein